jgi:hypothetical protein
MTETGLFANESVPYAPFKTVGAAYEGTVVRTSRQQQTAYVPKKKRDEGVQGEPLWWDPKTMTKPKWVYIVTVQTDLRDPAIPGDNGQRSIWIKGKQMEDAVKKAVRESGASRDGILPGGWFGLKFTHETPTESDGEEVSPTKHYAATYRPPEPGATEIVAGPASADPWAQPQNAFPTDNPWGTTSPAPAPSARPTGPTPEAQAAVERLLAQQQGGTA